MKDNLCRLLGANDILTVLIALYNVPFQSLALKPRGPWRRLPHPHHTRLQYKATSSCVLGILARLSLFLSLQHLFENRIISFCFFFLGDFLGYMFPNIFPPDLIFEDCFCYLPFYVSVNPRAQLTHLKPGNRVVSYTPDAWHDMTSHYLLSCFFFLGFLYK